MWDGTHLSFIDGKMWIDGRSHEARIPTEQYLLLLTNSEQRKGWDLIKIFLAVSGLYQTIDLNGRPSTVYVSISKTSWSDSARNTHAV